MATHPRGRILKTTDTSIAILEQIKESNGATLEEISLGLDLARSTVHGHLATLEKNRLLVKQNDEYHLGLRLLHLGEHAKRRDRRYEIAKNSVIDLSAETDEGADFTIEEHGRIVTIFNEVSNPSDPNFQSGKYFYMHNSAAGKAILAEFSTEKIDAVISRWGLPQETEHTTTNRVDLMSELSDIRERGYAFNNQEFMDGLRGVGVAIREPDGGVFGALSAGGPVYRLQDSRFREELPDILIRYRDELERKIKE